MAAKKTAPRPAASALPVAIIELYDIKFLDVLNAVGVGVQRSSTCALRMAPGAPVHPTVRVDNGALRVKPGRVRIRFRIVDEGIYPVGITFRLETHLARPGGRELIGDRDFPRTEIHLTERCLSIVDEFDALDANNDYKFSFVIQSTAGAAIGIIDPPIIHDPGDPA